MNYVIAVVPDRDQAEKATVLLEQEGLPKEKIAVFGQGDKVGDEYSFIDPKQKKTKMARLMSFWLVPFGFVAGYAFNLSTQYMLFPSLGALGNHLMGGLFGAIAGAMGSFFVGGGVGFSFGNQKEQSYRKQMKAGKYLVVVKGAPNLTNKANRILKQINPENLQGYVDPLTN
jgi:hypothetical protein